MSKFTYPIFTLKPGNNILMMSSKNGQGLCANFNKKRRKNIKTVKSKLPATCFTTLQKIK
jgi:lipid II:glycine glycyltransferase (peptidoglycan interpeptide bridge formation enzyme)